MTPLRQYIAEEVRGLFRDPRGRATVISRADDGLFGPRSVSWRVHGDVTSMLIGGTTALLLQMLHPAALAGVWDHSAFRNDMGGRLRRTAAFIAVTTYAATAQAEEAIERVRRIHDRIEGMMPDGARYAASDPALLRFVHAAEAWSFLAAYLRYRDPALPGALQDRYLAEIGQVARRLGAGEVPVTRRALAAYFEAVRPELRAGERAAAAAQAILNQPPARPALAPFQALTARAAIDLLPGWARRMHGFAALAPARPLVRAGAGGLAAAVRWAMASPSPAPA